MEGGYKIVDEVEMDRGNRRRIEIVDNYGKMGEGARSSGMVVVYERVDSVMEELDWRLQVGLSETQWLQKGRSRRRHPGQTM